MATRAGAIALIPAVPADTPDPEVQEIYALLAPQFGGELLNYHLVLANDPALMRVQLAMYLQVLGPDEELSVMDRLTIGLVVSKVKRCLYQEQVLMFLLRWGTPEEPGIPKERIVRIYQDFRQAGLPTRMQEICRFAWRVAENPRAVTVEDRARLFDEGLSDRSVLQIVNVVAYYQYITMFVHALAIQADMDEERQLRLLRASSRRRVQAEEDGTAGDGSLPIGSD
ncbi:MAG TPA: hypothetical protein VEI97_01215 [bacterium]|nr:hypothetical protein [bacterium]